MVSLFPLKAAILLVFLPFLLIPCFLWFRTHFFVYRCQNGCQRRWHDYISEGIWKALYSFWGIPDNNICLEEFKRAKYYITNLVIIFFEDIRAHSYQCIPHYSAKALVEFLHKESAKHSKMK